MNWARAPPISIIRITCDVWVGYVVLLGQHIDLLFKQIILLFKIFTMYPFPYVVSLFFIWIVILLICCNRYTLNYGVCWVFRNIRKGESCMKLRCFTRKRGAISEKLVMFSLIGICTIPNFSYAENKSVPISVFPLSWFHG